LKLLQENVIPGPIPKDEDDELISIMEMMDNSKNIKAGVEGTGASVGGDAPGEKTEAEDKVGDEREEAQKPLVATEMGGEVSAAPHELEANQHLLNAPPLPNYT